MFVFTFLALTIWTGVTFNNDQFRSRFVLHDYMKIALFPLALMGWGELFGFVPVILNLRISDIVFAMIILPFYFLNIRQASIVVVTIGFISNAIVTSINGAMPVDPLALAKMGVNSTNPGTGYVFTSETARLSFLGDWMYFPYAGGVFSPGDVLISLGLLILVIQYQKFRYGQTRL